ncbi:BAX inhibitor (BI)-1/YccA family protein [Salmonella enterica subsp. enterica serovar Virchow]|nr:BAX inhibitor (BI)-1/YccA family protein [Salmonella enterica subsp. enterica serovar Java]EBV3599699.1 BAX inhibitor (BI)-1/YccA family protein [Salmonella enterica subsp. enterica serovar Virchow]EBW2353170.1 BAX inhibitor (BI)-1/YccA family protein [Salmonella enterica subsp. enterica serovar Enteritidis]ECB6741084.1 Bax inhibitor-1/YccA family protein [Salmonella enterica subsp. enterica serovar Panama]ECI7685875.1 Bax inhibitor-1/YccA family protein [Salmonella enterica subsp. enterica 
MAELRNYQSQVGGRADSAIDEGLRAYMLKVYNLMAIALVVTGAVAYGAFNLAVQDGALTGFGQLLFTSPLRWVVMLAPLAFVFLFSFRIDRMSVSSAQMTFWAFAAVMGLSLSSIFLVFTGQSIVRTFFITAASFGALSLYGYTTKRDMTAMGSFLVMGVFGLILAMLVNLFLQSSALQFAISVIGVLIFAGLTAYDTQKIKESYYEAMDVAVAGRAAIMGALTLYLDFINLFSFLLNFLGDRD